MLRLVERRSAGVMAPTVLSEKFEEISAHIPDFVLSVMNAGSTRSTPKAKLKAVEKLPFVSNCLSSDRAMARAFAPS